MFISSEARGRGPVRETNRYENYRRISVEEAQFAFVDSNFHIQAGDVYEYLGWLDSRFPDRLIISIARLTSDNLDALNRLLYEADIRCSRPLVFETSNYLLREWRASVELPEDLAALNPEPAEEIRHWQSFLSLLDYQVELSGIWDARTEEATRKVEEKFGLPIGGPLSEQAVGWCDGVLAVVHAEPPAPEPVPEPSPYGFRGVLRLGDIGESVRILRTGLKAVGSFGTYVITDDPNFDQQTLKGVRRFQAYVGLPVNGIVDYATWTALFAKLESE